MIIDKILNLLTEVPTGIVADHIGRKKTIITSFVFIGLSSFLILWIYFVSNMYFAGSLIVSASICSAISYTLYNGSFNAWIVDTVREQNIQEGHGPILTRSYGHMIIAKLVGAIMGIGLYLSGYPYFIFAIGCILSLLCALYCAVTMEETKSIPFYQGKLLVRESFKRMRNILVNGFKISTKVPPVFFSIILYGSVMMLIYIAMFLWPITLKSNFGVTKMTFYWFLIIVLNFVTSFIGAKGLEKYQILYIEKTKKRMPNEKLWNLFVIISLITGVSLFILGFSNLKGPLNLALFIAVVAIFNIGYGFLMPAFNTFINYYIPLENSKERSTILSFSAMFLNLLLIIFLFPSNKPQDTVSAAGWMLPSGVVIVVAIIMHILMMRYFRKKVAIEEPDKILEGESISYKI